MVEFNKSFRSRLRYWIASRRWASRWFRSSEVGNGSRHFQDPVVGPGGEGELLHGLLEKVALLFVDARSVFRMSAFDMRALQRREELVSFRKTSGWMARALSQRFLACRRAFSGAGIS